MMHARRRARALGASVRGLPLAPACPRGAAGHHRAPRRAGYYLWKNWRGVPWARPSVGARWQADVLSSWGPFEQIDLCVQAGIEPIISTTSQDQVPRHTGPYDCCNAEEMAQAWPPRDL